MCVCVTVVNEKNHFYQINAMKVELSKLIRGIAWKAFPRNFVWMQKTNKEFWRIFHVIETTIATKTF